MKAFLKKAYIGLVLCFLYAPIILLIVFSFNQSKTMGYWTGFTLGWYQQLFHNASIMEALKVTISIAVCSALISTVLGTAAAIGIYDMRRLPKNVILNISYLPILNPDIVTGISLMVLFLFAKMELGWFTMLLAHTAFNVPYVLYSVLPKLNQMNQNTYEAALDLGASPMRALFRVVLPEIMPGIVTGGLLAFTLSLDDFVISLFTGGNTQNLSVLIYSMAKRGINPQVNALSAIMFICVLGLLLIINGRQSGDDKPRKTRRARKTRGKDAAVAENAII